MSTSLLQESRLLLEQIRTEATQRATQEAIAAAGNEIQRRAALLFESTLAGQTPAEPTEPAAAEPVATEPAATTTEPAATATPAPAEPDLTPETPAPSTEPLVTTTPETSWGDVIKELLADPVADESSEELAPGTTETTTTTVELELPDPEPAGGNRQALGAPATTSPASAPQTLSEATDLTQLSDQELLQEIFTAPDNAHYDVMQNSTPEPTSEPTTARSFEDVLKEALDAETPLTASPEGTEPTATEPAATEPLSTEPTATEPTAEGQPADVNELAAALASLAAPAGDGTEPTATEPAATEPTAGAPMSHEEQNALQEDFQKLNEGVMVIAAQNKNQAAEIKLLKEQIEQKDAQLNTVKHYLVEAATLSSKTALANQLLMENTTTKDQKVLIMESLGSTTSRQEAEHMYTILSGKLQKNSLLNEEKTAQHLVERVFSSESGLLQESVSKAAIAPTAHPMAQKWGAAVNYKSQG